MRGSIYRVNKSGTKIEIVINGSTGTITASSLSDLFNTLNNELNPLKDDLEALNADMKALNENIAAMRRAPLNDSDQKKNNRKKESTPNKKSPSSFWEKDVSAKTKSISTLKSLIAARREVETNKYSVEQLDDGVYTLVKKTGGDDMSPAAPLPADAARQRYTGSSGPG